MSWVNKRRGQTVPNAAGAPPVQMYNPNQHSTGSQENQWQQNNWYSEQQSQFVPKQEVDSTNHYWQQISNNVPQQQPQHVYNNQNAQYGNFSDQTTTGYYQNTGAYQQHQQQAYGNVQYNQQYGQNNVYGTQQQQQQNEGDAWNWGWGDEDNSNVQVKQEALANNAVSNIGESFGTDETWNWHVEDTKQTTNQVENVVQPDNDLFPRVGSAANKLVKAENKPDLPKVQDNLAVAGKRGKLDTPQWSVESQLSQESSDDVLHTSESDRMMSRSSTVSHSPVSGQEVLGQPLEGMPLKTEQNSLDVAGNHQFENKEILTTIKQEQQQPDVKLNSTPPPPKTNPTPPLPKVNPTPPPLKNTQTPPLPPSGSTDEHKNIYKRTGALSHKAANKLRSATGSSTANSYLAPFHNQNVNLETPPDNSEQPDPVPLGKTANKPLQQWPDNNEAPINDRNQYLETGQLSQASQQDALHSGRQDVNDTLPPPGLRRMVLGQIEQNENTNNVTGFGDEPPPGLSRMVLGQTESNANPTTLNVDEDLRSQYEPPEGLHRMIPGESSSPESTLRQTHRQDEDSEPEFSQLTSHAPQQRSATIGADTPPVDAVASISSIATTNRSETIGGGNSTTTASVSQDNNGRQRGTSASSSESRIAAVGIDNPNRKNKTDHKLSDPSKSDSGRRESIEGQTQDSEISNMVNAVRNLTVGENSGDRPLSNHSANDSGVRKASREESSDSEEPKKTNRRETRDKRHEKKRSEERDRYSPDAYKDKRYEKKRYRDRRYEDDTEDYYSDKEKDRRRSERDYERKYGSLRKDKERERRRRDQRDPRDSRDSRDPREPRDPRDREYTRDGRDSRRNDYYYNRYEDDYDDERASRPTSRSDSMHESYRDSRDKYPRNRSHRDRDRDRERYRGHRDHRDSYNQYQSFAYDPYNPYYQQYQYYENLRRTNPQAYAEWYRKYYQQATGQASNYGTEDRASVHSGRSSANDELAKDRYTRQSYYSQSSLPQMGGYYGDTHTHSISGHYGLDNSSYTRPFDNTDSSLIFEDTTIAQRLTPAKFTTAHIRASISSGKLLRVLPNYPIEGDAPIVEVCNLQQILENDEEFKELNSFPGPLVKGVSHKKTIIEYCENKIRSAGFNNDIVDVDSYVLMWELLILLIRQNGMVVGTDIAELLLKNKNHENNVRPSSVLSNISSAAGDTNVVSEASNHQNSDAISGSTHSVLKEEEVTEKFREYLLYGSCKEALEWAMKHGLWGHALFLASKLDKRTYASVMMRFANGLTINDPLQTLYQLLSGRMPAAVTCVADEKWGDWRPHLAMILSNSSQRPELNCKAIASLGDTLAQRGSFYAAQFCYLMAQVGFGPKDDAETRMCLLGSDHGRPFGQFATNEAIHMTEIYEYAIGLNDPQFVIPEFQIYKYLLATRLADRGLLEKSLAYLEKLSGYIIANPTGVPSALIDNVCNLADRLKFSDPVGDADVDETEFGANLETSRPDHSWLKELRSIQNDHQAGLITHDEVQNVPSYTEPVVEPLQLQTTYENNVQKSWQQQYDQQYQQVNQQQYQAVQPSLIDNQQGIVPSQENDYSSTQFQDQQYWQNQTQWGDQQQQQQQNQFGTETVDQQQNYYGSNTTNEEVTPQISMPNQSKGKSPYDDEPSPESKKESPTKPKPKQASPEKSTSTGWFGGIFSKISLKPKNQMKLPDDKNPKIVWDQEKKRWVNMEDDGNDGANELKPPPKMADMMPRGAPQGSSGIAAPPPGGGSGIIPSNNPIPTLEANNPMSNQYVPSDAGVSNLSQAPVRATGPPGGPDNGNQVNVGGPPNMFKLQRGRNLKKSYVDVFNPNGKTSGPASLTNSDVLPPAMQTPQMNFFIPQPVTDPNAPMDFLTPAPPMQFNENQMSRWSSASSLSREVEFYMRQKSHPR
ncbi:protein transport protein Sec16A-like isoform X4 [Aethina tumida]|uniref:protein transport protein Sec16A-like isoform X4 n=1 Tax=Aethina tumida TaxID=116153 RepID=UPI002148BB88|nr:protein transport protein Sec16A-like isoform X4 [Aethina tumida]